jgi:hypothetical protein
MGRFVLPNQLLVKLFALKEFQPTCPGIFLLGLTNSFQHVAGALSRARVDDIDGAVVEGLRSDGS